MTLRRSIYKALNRVAQVRNLRIEFSPAPPPWEVDVRFQALWESVVGRTMIGPRALYMLYEAVISTEAVLGDAVEFGVWRGGSAGVISQTLKILKSKRTVHLFESFRGLPPPDISRDGVSHDEGEYSVAEHGVREFLLGLKTNNWQLHTGWLADTFPKSTPAAGAISLVHVDVDLYESVWAALDLCFDRLSPGGVILIDDYANPLFPGASAAADSFSTMRGFRPFYLATGQALIVKGWDKTS